MKKDIEYIGEFTMPPHNPLINDRRIWCRFELIRVLVEAKNPDVFKNIIPFPLEYTGNKYYIVVNRVKDFSGNFSEYIKNIGWNEVVYQLPVVFDKKEYSYTLEGYIDNPAILISGREIFGYPKMMADIAIQAERKSIHAVVSQYKSDNKIISVEYESKRFGTIFDIGKGSDIINLKQIPSAENGKGWEVKQLVKPLYKKKRPHGISVGSANVVFHEYIPEYIKAAGIHIIKKAVLIDLELIIDSGKILYNYSTADDSDTEK